MSKPSWYTLIMGMNNLTHADLESGVHIQICKAIEEKVDENDEYVGGLQIENAQLEATIDALIAVYDLTQRDVENALKKWAEEEQDA